MNGRPFVFLQHLESVAEHVMISTVRHGEVY
jgi:hypothetical protein